jgi:hypothetical protein
LVHAALPKTKERSRNLSNPGGLYHWGAALALGEARGFVLIGIYTAKLLAIGVVNADKPMVMFPAAVPAKRVLFFLRIVFCHVE